MALKVWVNGSMKKLTRHRMVTFVGGTKKKLVKGITFINGEKKILWQIGEVVFNSWLIPNLQYPNATTVGSDICGLEADENKVVYKVDKYICRANVENISSPYNDGVNSYGVITYRKPQTETGKSNFEANEIVFSNGRKTKTLNQNKIDVAQSNLGITSSQEYTNSYTASSVIVVPATFQYYISGLINVGNGYGECRVYGDSGKYVVAKNILANGSTNVANINAYGYSNNSKPKVWCYAVYNNRYLLFGASYQSVSGGSYAYSLKKVDLSNGTVSELLSNKTLPITSILIEGSNILVTYENKMVKMNISGTVSATYTSSNDMPTLVGKCGDFYYLTSTRVEDNANKLNIEIVEYNNFASGEVKQQNINMVETLCFPYISETGYLCFATKSYTTFSGYVPAAIGGSGRQSSANQLNGAGRVYTSYSNVELRICRIQCY